LPAIALQVKDETEYAYSVARVRVLETRLLDRAVLDRLVDSATPEEALRILSETEYAEALRTISEPAGFEAVLSAELGRVYDYVRRFCPDPALLDLAGLRLDLHNVKVLLKEKYLGGSAVPAAFTKGGALDPEIGRRAISQGDLRELPPDYAEIIVRAEEAVEKTGDPQSIDLVVDAGMFALGLEIARASGFEFLEQVWTALIDVTNIRSLVRINRMGRSKEFLERCLIEGGLLPTSVLFGLHGAPPGAVVDALGSTRYAGLAGDGLKEGSRLDLLADNFVIGFLRKAKHKPFGPEPVIAYVLAKEMEIRNLRIILTGKVNGLPAATIRERLRDTYV
jgi:V/A-type H+-transporting ATPase subunit C